MKYENFTEKPIMKKRCDIISYDGIHDIATIAVSCILENGEVTFTGNEHMIETLKKGIAGIYPKDGEKFLIAVNKEYHGTYVFASDIT